MPLLPKVVLKRRFHGNFRQCGIISATKGDRKVGDDVGSDVRNVDKINGEVTLIKKILKRKNKFRSQEKRYENT